MILCKQDQRFEKRRRDRLLIRNRIAERIRGRTASRNGIQKVRKNLAAESAVCCAVGLLPRRRGWRRRIRRDRALIFLPRPAFVLLVILLQRVVELLPLEQLFLERQRIQRGIEPRKRVADLHEIARLYVHLQNRLVLLLYERLRRIGDDKPVDIRLIRHPGEHPVPRRGYLNRGVLRKIRVHKDAARRDQNDRADDDQGFQPRFHACSPPFRYPS